MGPCRKPIKSALGTSERIEMSFGLDNGGLDDTLCSVGLRQLSTYIQTVPAVRLAFPLDGVRVLRRLAIGEDSTMSRKRKDDDSSVAIAPPPISTDSGGDEDKEPKPKAVEMIQVRTTKEPWGFIIRVREEVWEKYPQGDESLLVGSVVGVCEYWVSHLFENLQAAHVQARALGIKSGHYDVLGMHYGQWNSSGPLPEDE